MVWKLKEVSINCLSLAIGKKLCKILNFTSQGEDDNKSQTFLKKVFIGSEKIA